MPIQKGPAYNYRQMMSFHIEVSYPSRLDMRKNINSVEKRRKNRRVNKHTSLNV